MDSDAKGTGYRFPAEWEPQSAVWFAWPTREDLWPASLATVQQRLCELYVLVSRFQPVHLLCPLRAQPAVRERLQRAGDSSGVRFFDFETDDVWIRDFGPLFLLSAGGDELAISDWRYNAWGDKFPLQARDNAASRWIAEQLGFSRFPVDAVIEGGGIESNGAGQILTTEAVLLNPNRNGPMDRRSMEALLEQHLNAQQVLWLGDGLIGDDTDGHIDNLARFFERDGILLASAHQQDANYPVLAENLERARRFRTLDGQPFKLVEIPIPEPVYLNDERLAASYMNYLLVNDGVIVPTYGQPTSDAHAIEVLQGCFPGRRVVGFDCREILQEGGAIHCMSQHQPATNTPSP
ncbi:MAG: agmatine deiminase family protein [Halioglobus sp.]|nr:agmatine deiminase family protein [Halioglobus sp.]